MRIKAQTFTELQGMNQDLAPSKRSSKLAYEIKNMRITIENNNTLFAWSNEKGTKELPLFSIDDYEVIGNNEPLSLGAKTFKEDSTVIEQIKENSSGAISFTYNGGTLYIPSFVSSFYLMDNIKVPGEEPNPPENTDTLAITIQSISITPTTITVQKGKSITPNIIIFPTNASNKQLNWESNNSKIATVSNTGEISGIATGEAIITATTTDSSNIQTSIQVTVLPNTDESLGGTLTVSPTYKELQFNDTIQLTANIPSEITLASGTVCSTEDLTLLWKSSDYSKVEVSSTGLVKCLTHIDSTVTVSCYFQNLPEIEATCEIKIIAFNENTSTDGYIATINIPRTEYTVSSDSNTDNTFTLIGIRNKKSTITLKWLEQIPNAKVQVWCEDTPYGREQVYYWRLKVNAYKCVPGVYPFIILNETNKTTTEKTLNLIVT